MKISQFVRFLDVLASAWPCADKSAEELLPLVEFRLNREEIEFLDHDEDLNGNKGSGGCDTGDELFEDAQQFTGSEELWRNCSS